MGIVFYYLLLFGTNRALVRKRCISTSPNEGFKRLFIWNRLNTLVRWLPNDFYAAWRSSWENGSDVSIVGFHLVIPCRARFLRMICPCLFCPVAFRPFGLSGFFPLSLFRFRLRFFYCRLPSRFSMQGMVFALNLPVSLLPCGLSQPIRLLLVS